MKNYIFLTISLIVLWSCGQQEDAIVDFQEPATNGWTEIPVGIISMEELTSTPGAISFTDVVNNRFTLIDGQFVCAQDYPETTFQEVGISNLMEYQGYLIDNDESQVFGHEGRVFYANKNGKGNAGNTDLDCSFLTSTKNKRCIDADAVATALNVMSLESGRQMVENNDKIEAFWILKDNGKLNTVQSTGMNVNLID